MKRIATTNVERKMTRSSPRRVNEVADPHDFVSPPLDFGWMRIRTENTTANMISTTSNEVLTSIEVLYYKIKSFL